MSTSKFELFRKHWLWSILATVVSLSMAVYGVYLQYRSAQHEMGGSLMATYYQRSLNNRGSRTIVVCMENANVKLNGLYVTPTLDNPREYSIKDFSLSIKATCDNVELVPSSFVETHEYGGGEWLYKYKDNLLAAHDDTKRIFTDFKVQGNPGRCLIKTKASHDGAASAIEYNTDVWFLIVPRQSSQSFDNWKINCKKRIYEVVSDKYYDVFYYSHDSNLEKHFDIALNGDDNVVNTKSLPQSVSKPIPKKEDKPQPTLGPSKPIEAKKSPVKIDQVRTESKPVEVKPANNNQDVNIVKYSASKDGKLFTIHYELDKIPNTTSKYLLYGNYSVSGKDKPYVFAYLIDLSTVVKSCTYSINTIDSLAYHLNELRIIKEAEPNGIVEITHDAGRRVIKNVTDNKITVIVYTSANRYRSDILEKSEVFYDAKDNDNKIYVFDTGEKSIKEVKSADGTNMIVKLLFSLAVVLGIVCIIAFISDLQDTKSISKTLNEFFALDEFKRMPFYERILYVIFLISPIFTVFFAVKFVAKIIELYLTA